MDISYLSHPKSIVKFFKCTSTVLYYCTYTVCIDSVIITLMYGYCTRTLSMHTISKSSFVFTLRMGHVALTRIQTAME